MLERLEKYIACYFIDKVKLKKGELAMHVASLKLVMEAKSHPQFTTVAMEMAELLKGMNAEMKKVTAAIDMACAETESEIVVEDNGDVRVFARTIEG